MKSILPLFLATFFALASLPGLAAAQDAGASESGSQMTLADYEQAQSAGDGYNSDYLFALSRGLGDAAIHPAGKAPRFIFTVQLDIVLLPCAAIGGFFG